MMPQKIKNKNYRQFLDQGVIEFINEEHIEQAIKNIRGRHAKEGRVLLLMLYYTGARPVEILNLRARDVEKTKHHVIVKMPASKRGLPRPIHLPYKLGFVKQIWDFASGVFPDMYLFLHYRDNYVRKTRNGGEREEITNTLRYHVQKWFRGVVDGSITPYFLRHNRFSKLAMKGASDRDIMFLKGSRTWDSVKPYQHFSKHAAMKIARRMD